MNPTNFLQANHVFRRPASMTDEQCGVLHVHAGQDQDGLPVSISCWQPTEEERAAIAAGGLVWLWVYGIGHPPVVVSAENPWPQGDAS